MKLIINLIAILYLFNACSYSPPEKYYFDKSKVIERPFDFVWSKTLDWFTVNNYVIKNLDKNSGFISSEFYLNSFGENKALDCGSGGYLQGMIDYFVNLNIFLEKLSESKTKVSINILFNAKLLQTNYNDGSVSSSTTIVCNSTGLLEGKLFEFIKGRSDK